MAGRRKVRTRRMGNRPAHTITVESPSHNSNKKYAITPDGIYITAKDAIALVAMMEELEFVPRKNG